MKNLVIGNTSQLSRYFPESFIKISSRDIDYDYISSQSWDCVYICFAEQRTFLVNDKNFDTEFSNVNFNLVKKVIEKLKANRIFYYSTADLWNDCNGAVSINTPFKFKPNSYTISKYNITMELLNKKKYSNVSVVYPFNFNSIYRKSGYLFAKVFDSIINETNITIGDTHYYRDIVHPEMVVDCTLKHDRIGEDFIVGSGRLTYINDMIVDLYTKMGMDYKKYVTINIENFSHYRNRMFYNIIGVPEYRIENVINKTINELMQVKGSKK